MKIAIVTDAWRPQINGVVTTYLQTIKVLETWGYEVACLTPEHFKTVSCPTYPEIALSMVTASTIKSILADIGPHAVHIATEGPLGWAARRACLSSGFSYSTAYHTRFPEYVRLRFPIPLRLSYKVMKQFHNSGSGMMVSTPELKREMEDRGFTNVRLWSRGVDMQLFRPRNQARPTTTEPVFTFVGRVAPEKNIEAFLALNLPGKKRVIGSGPALPGLQQKYPETEFTGYKQGEELAELVAASSVFVFPSLTDTFGVVQLEAMACGVPVAAFPVDGPKSVIRNGFNGWMDDDLKTAALRCLEISPDNCRQFAKSYSWEACTEQFASNLMFQKLPFPLLSEAA